MAETYVVVLDACEPGHADALAVVLTKAFGLKDATSTSVVQSAPIVLLSGLGLSQAAAMQLALRPLQLAGASIAIELAGERELPKIDWPRPPPVFKQDIEALVRQYGIQLPTPHGSFLLLDLLTGLLTGDLPGLKPSASAPEPEPSIAPKPTRLTFVGADLGEITPFGNPVLPPQQTDAAGDGQGAADLASRMDELFPEEGSTLQEIVPDTQSVSNILDQLLPDDEPATSAPAALPGQPDSTKVRAAKERSPTTPAETVGAAGCSVFLAKINDENRRQKAVQLLSELSGISTQEADALSKRVIIPVLRGVTKQEAESVKHRFAEIGVLARVRAN